MARETKVGLLAGLAFIICFAIILANRGRQDLTVSPLTNVTGGGGNMPIVLPQTASRMDANPSVKGGSSPTGRLMPPSSTPHEAVVTRLDRPTPAPPTTSGTDLQLSETPLGGTLPTPGRLVDGGENNGNQTAERALTSRPPDDQALRLELERRLGGSASDSSTTSILNQQPVLPPQPTSTTKSVSYTVAQGDTLSKIALAHFGNKSRLTVNAIFEANRSVLTSPDDIRTGLVLSLPVVEGMARMVKSEPTQTNHAATSKAEAAKSSPVKKSTEPPAAPYRWYQVKKNDRYASIAREQLGDGGRWRELYELNKDKFPNPQSIREGVRIKLPAVKALASAEGRR